MVSAAFSFPAKDGENLGTWWTILWRRRELPGNGDARHWVWCLPYPEVPATEQFPALMPLTFDEEFSVVFGRMPFGKFPDFFLVDAMEAGTSKTTLFSIRKPFQAQNGVRGIVLMRNTNCKIYNWWKEKKVESAEKKGIFLLCRGSLHVHEEWDNSCHLWIHTVHDCWVRGVWASIRFLWCSIRFLWCSLLIFANSFLRYRRYVAVIVLTWRWNSLSVVILNRARCDVPPVPSKFPLSLS